MWPMSTKAQQIVLRSHSIAIRGTAFGSSIGMLTDLPISGGSVTVDSSSQVRRTATVEIARPDLWPADPLDVLSPFGSEILLEYGIVIPGIGTEWIPLIRGVISDADRVRPSTNSFTLSLVDRSARVAEDRLDAPSTTTSGATVVNEIKRLIQETLPGALVTDETGSTQVAPDLQIERERWADGVEKLADAIGAEVFADPQGDFVIRPQPTLADDAVWQIRTGRGGILVSASEKLTRDRVYNRMVVTGTRSDGTPPVRSAVSDTDPLSPTLYGGAFGKKPKYYSSPLLTTIGQCTATATSFLARVKGIQASVGLQAIVNPALDAGDVIRVYHQGWQVHIVDKITIPLGVSSPQAISTRSLDLPGES